MPRVDESQRTQALTEVMLHNLPPDAETVGPLKGGMDNGSILQDGMP